MPLGILKTFMPSEDIINNCTANHFRIKKFFSDLFLDLGKIDFSEEKQSSCCIGHFTFQCI